MRYVIIRDDDTNALTPVECLERLYRPFLDQGLPVNLATIPAVSRAARMADGSPEGFLPRAQGPAVRNLISDSGGETENGGSMLTATAVIEPDTGKVKSPEDDRPCAYVPLAENRRLVRYLKDNPGFKIVQHGCHHDYLEFDCDDPVEIGRKLDTGKQHLQEAGFRPAETFVAPYDRLSRPALREVAARFRVLSTGWYELRRLPYAWWPTYLLKKLRRCRHWRFGRTLLLSHPGCLLSCHRTYSTMLGGITHYVQNQQLTVLVTHWWEYFRNGVPDEDFIGFLHETASFLATHPEIRVVSFADLVNDGLPCN